METLILWLVTTILLTYDIYTDKLSSNINILHVVTLILITLGQVTLASVNLASATLVSLHPLIHVDASEEQHHGKDNVNSEAELFRKQEAAKNSCEHVGGGRAVLLHHIVQPLEDSGHHQAFGSFIV